jgi:hypothetical protein
VGADDNHHGVARATPPPDPRDKPTPSVAIPTGVSGGHGGPGAPGSSEAGGPSELAAAGLLIWLHQRPRTTLVDKRGEDRLVVGIEGSAGGRSGAYGGLTVTASTEDRVEALERQIQRLDELGRTTGGDLAEEKGRRIEADRQLDTKLAAYQEGEQQTERKRLGLDWLGFYFLAPGVALTTWPVEVARWINHVL